MLYHYPKAKYQPVIASLVDALVLCYEPRRGGRSADSAGGGRMAFVGMAFLDRWWTDPDDETHGYAELRAYLEFSTVVGIAATAISPKALQSAVLSVDYAIAEQIVTLGLLLPSETTAQRVGLADADLLLQAIDRPVAEYVVHRPVRDAAFRLNVIERAYNGRCALTGIRMTNGLGRAEADAAHIRPVEAGGPDSIRNGLALTKSMHWAFDRGLVSLADDGRILTVDRGLDAAAQRMLLPGGIATLPSTAALRPHPVFLAWHRENRFKGTDRHPPPSS